MIPTQPTMREQLALARLRAMTTPSSAPALGAVSPVESTASFLGTDRKTLLLIGVLGLVGGYLLNDAKRATQRTVKRTARRLRGAFRPKAVTVTKPGPGVSVASIALTAAALGGGYYLYRQWMAGQAAAARLSPQPVHKSTPLPKLNPQTGHWQRPS